MSGLCCQDFTVRFMLSDFCCQVCAVKTLLPCLC